MLEFVMPHFVDQFKNLDEDDQITEIDPMDFIKQLMRMTFKLALGLGAFQRAFTMIDTNLTEIEQTCMRKNVGTAFLKLVEDFE